MKWIDKIKSKLKKEPKFRKKGWEDLTLKQYIQIADLLQEPDEYTTFNILDILYSIDSASMTIPEFSEYKDALSFLSTEIPHTKLKEVYTINGREYQSGKDLTQVSVAQFTDYNNYIKNKASYNTILSVFFIPVGHKYNDGYDIKQVQEDLVELDMPTVVTLAFFFRIQLSIFVIAFQSSLRQQMETMEGLTEEQRSKILQALDSLDWLNLAFSPYLSHTVKKQTLQ